MSKTLFSERPKNLRELRPYIKTLHKINDLEEEFKALSDEDLKNKTIEFKERLNNGETVKKLAAEAFATVREASVRVLGMRHFNVQLLGGLALLDGNVSEMKTGEGKTLVASLPSYLMALTGKGVHVITVNDYLAQRDKELIGQIHEFLGLTVGLNIAGMGNYEKKEAYQCDITYGVGSEFGFDYLRDNTVYAPALKVQKEYHYAIVDEIDSVLIDEAKTPLIIAGKDMPTGRLYKVCAKVVRQLKADEDFTFDFELKVVNFTDDGITKCERAFGISNVFELEHTSLFHALIQSLRARMLFERDVDYIVEDDEIKLIDMSTGRVMEGRSLSDGLHQAIEAKEGVTITDENKTYASITVQNYYRMYPILSGMTGTAKSEEEEFRRIYGMDVVVIPPNRPNRRIDQPDSVFMTREDKYAHLVKEVQKRHATGQPILIGTTSILQSEEIAKLLDEAELEYKLLNAKSVEKEAQLISEAGQLGHITIATNMAGRGTDIMLGDGVAELGGLHVIGTERNENERIDNQLKGRSGRQGDPGSSGFIISIEDYLFKRFAVEELERIKPKLTFDENGFITSSQIHKFVDTAQKISEGVHSQFREYNLNLENVLDEQRNVMYKLRDEIMYAENPYEFVLLQIETLPDDTLAQHDEVEWLLDQNQSKLLHLENDLNRILLPEVNFASFEEEIQDNNQLKDFMAPLITQHLEQLREFPVDEDLEATVKAISLAVIDAKWMKHLDTMAQLKEGIGIRQYKQEDPIQQFEREGYTLFEHMFMDVKFEISERLKLYINQLIKRTMEAVESQQV